jgi:hypothetical protein
MNFPPRKLLPLLGLCLVCGACAPFGSSQPDGSASPSPLATYNAQARPSSPATLTFVQPLDKAVLKAGIVHIQLDLAGAQIVRQTTTHINATTGHIHFSVNDKLVAMNYSAQQDTPLTPGVYRLTAEFVAADHVPFNPRVMTSIIIDVQ